MPDRDGRDLARRARGELLDLLEALIAEPSPCGKSGAGAQRVLKEYLEANGFVTETHEDDPQTHIDHPEYSPPPPAAELPVNLTARPAENEPLDLVLFAHVDTEPAGEGWTAPPHTPVRQEGRLYGLGAADDKSGLAAAAVAGALALRHQSQAPTILSVHGKGGGARGTLPTFQRLGAAGSAALYVHPPENGAGLAVLKTESRGIVDIELEVHGWRGPPVEIGTPESARFEDGGDALAACLGIVESVRRDLEGAEVHLGRLDAGEAPGLTPLRASAGVRVLFEGELTVARVLGAFHVAAETQTRTHSNSSKSFRVEVRAPGLRANPAVAPWTGAFAGQLRTAVAGVTGGEPAPYTHHLASDIRFPIRMGGVPAIGVGCRAGGFYGPDEWVDIDDLVRLVAVLLALIEAGAGGS